MNNKKYILGLLGVLLTTSVAAQSVGPPKTAPVAETIFLTGSAATYAVPAGTRLLVVRMWGAGGGGTGSGTSCGTGSTAGGDTIFNSIHAAGGSAGSGVINGGAGGTTAADGNLRLAGSYGNPGTQFPVSATNSIGVGGNGGGRGAGLGGQAGGAGGAAVANSGGGGGGGGLASAIFATTGGDCVAGGGGEGEYAEMRISSPTTSYTYTVGAVGAGGSAGSSGFAGGAGGTGKIAIEVYN